MKLSQCILTALKWQKPGAGSPRVAIGFVLLHIPAFCYTLQLFFFVFLRFDCIPFRKFLFLRVVPALLISQQPQSRHMKNSYSAIVAKVAQKISVTVM